MQKEQNVRWILVVSVFTFLFYCLPFYNVFFLGGFFRVSSYTLPLIYSPMEFIWYIVNNIDTLFFLLTITFATLFTSGFSYKNLMFKLSIYFFIASNCLLFIRFMQMFVGMPYRY